MTRKLFTLLLLAGTVILSAQEVKLMFGAQKTPVRKEQSKFLDFRYVSQHDPMFTAAPKKLQGWNYNPAGGAAYGSFSSPQFSSAVQPPTSRHRFLPQNRR